MKIDENGRTIEMTASEVGRSYWTFSCADVKLAKDECWCASCFGPCVEHEIELFFSLSEAFSWIMKSIGDNLVTELIKHKCWKDEENCTEWDIRKVKIPG